MSLHSFPPMIAKEPKVLILGSMPSVTSLAKSEYYGFKHNRFWKILGTYFHIEFTDYAQKIDCIMEHHIILWDVIAHCDREGSLDAKIKNEVCNDIDALIREYSSIQMVICNGRKSYDLYKKHFAHIPIPCHVMPSTSNANRAIKESELYTKWFEILDRVFQ